MHFRTANELNLSAARQKLLSLLIPVLGWGLLFALRSVFYRPWCAITPTPCVVDAVNFVDRLVFHFGSLRADSMSNIVQNTVGVVAFILPWILYSSKHIQKALGETFVLLQASLWNLFLLESLRTIAQRPRPLVFHDPLGDGANIHQYTSFYSGHTSFVALAALSMYFMVRRRFPHQKWLPLNFLILYACLSIATGSLRVLGGRHYPTDVIFAFLIGSAIVLGLNTTNTRQLLDSHD